jgi:sulfate adenylyltransferase
MVPAAARDDVKARASQLPLIQLSARARCDLELLATGAFSPLDRFMGHTDQQRVLDEMRLQSGQLFPLPVTLPVEASPALHLDHDIALRNAKISFLAVMTLEEVYPWDLTAGGVWLCECHRLSDPSPFASRARRVDQAGRC